MKRCKTHVLCVCLFSLAAISAYGQRVNLGIDIGQTTDKYGSFPSNTSLVLGIDGQVTVLKANQKKGGPSIVAGGEMMIPSDTANHAKEYALFGGPMWQTRNLTIGFNAQIHKIVQPPATEGTQVLNRYTMELLELPLTIKYAFGPGRHAFIQVQGSPEFSPRWRNAGFNLVSLPHPSLDQGYYARGTAGYNFGKWYAKASYQYRAFTFAENAGNPNGLYNWRNNMIFGGVGLVF